MKTTFVLDANVMIQAKRRFYPFDICPGYWKTVKWHREQTNLISIDRVWDEIECGGDDLWEWVRNTFGRESFADTDDVTTQARFAEMMAWVQVQPQFSLQAKEQFAKEEIADGWLAAFAKTRENGIVVTLEEFDSTAKKKVPLPNVCRAFAIECISPFEMLRRLSVRLDWNP